MAIWNSQYELNPANYRNPGEGAFHIRDVKEAVRERGTTEHIWGEDEATLGVGLLGWHREGTARVYSQDGGQGSRPQEERITDTVRPGRVQVNTTGGVGRKQDGTNLQNVAGYDYNDQRQRKIVVSVAKMEGSTGSLVDPSDPEETEFLTIFDYDQLVDIHQDQTDIKGIKVFSTEVRVPDVPGLASIQENWETEAAKSNGEEKVAVNLVETHNRTENAKYHNSFDPTVVDNTSRRITDNSNPISGSSWVIPESIQVSKVYATKLYGAVYA